MAYSLSVCLEGISPLPTAVDAIVNFVKPEKQRRCVDTWAWSIITRGLYLIVRRN